MYSGFKQINMTKFYVLFAVSLFCVTGFSQSNAEWVIATYKTGARYIGEKISEKDELVTLRIHTGDTIKINKYLAHEYLDGDNSIVNPNGKYFKTKGRFWSTHFGFNFSDGGDGNGPRETVHWDIMYGEQLNDKYSISVGLGSEFNEARVAGFSFDTQFNSLFAQGRYSILNRQTRLFAFGRVGYGFSNDAARSNTQREHKGGLMAKYGIMWQFASRSSSKFQLSFGHYMQKASGRESFLDLIGNELDTEYDILINRLVFTIGFDF